MIRLTRVLQAAFLAAVLLGGVTVADDVRELTWEELLPDGPAPEPVAVPMAPHSEGLFENDDYQDDSLESLFAMPTVPLGVVEELDGQLIKLPGFVVPLELDEHGDVSEFLLVPYFGACIHYPPPPPNQMVYVSAEEPFDIEMTWAPIWITGDLATNRRSSEYGSVDYSMTSAKVEEYEY